MSLTRVRLLQFTAFADLDIDFSPGVNVFLGANGTGKTHLMKVCYAACEATHTDTSFAEKLVRIFLPSDRAPGRLIKRQGKSASGSVTVYRGDWSIRAAFTSHARVPKSVRVRRARGWVKEPVESVYIPVKEMLSNAPGFLALYRRRETHFEEVYADILDRAYLPLLRSPTDSLRRRLLRSLQDSIDGKVHVKNETFFLRNRQGNLEFTLLAEGMRKLGLLWILIQNGTLSDGSVLFWDEPETNLNPKMFGVVVDILLKLQRDGVQVFFATHDYVMLKELDLQKQNNDEVAFHALYHEDGEIGCRTVDNYLDVHPNAIAEAFADLYDREVDRSLGDLIR